MGKKYESVNRVVALILVFIMAFSLITPVGVYGLSGAGTEENPYKISSADDFPADIPDGIWYELTADITLASDQQISTLAGTLDGKGHVITLSGGALADNVTGTIQNLGIAGSVDKYTSGYVGSFAMNFSGIIQNSYCTATIKPSGSWNEAGGVVAQMTGGTIRNCYFAGTFDGGMFNGGIGAYVTGGNISDCYYMNTYSTYGMGFGINPVNTSSATKDELTANDAEILNANITDTGYKWAVPQDGSNNGLPLLQSKDASSSGGVNRDVLDRAIENAEAYTDESVYTAESWKAMQEALKVAREIGVDATQGEINEAAQSLNNAIAGLEKRKPTAPAALPDEGVIEISSKSDLASKIDDDNAGKYFVLTEDIVLDSSYINWTMNDFNGVLDGQGHTITFDGASRLFNFANIGTEGIVQNIQFKGTIGASGTAGPLGTTLKGSVINCSFNIDNKQGYSNAAIAGTLDSGIISNCYIIGSPAKALVAKYNSGKVVNTYWLSGLDNSSVPSDAVQGGGEKQASNMRTLDFVDLLNQNRGEYGTQWGQNSDGYPYFGENKEYTEPGDEPSEYYVNFTPYNSQLSQTLEDGVLMIKTGDVDPFRIAGTLSLKDYVIPEGHKVEWQYENVSPNGCIRTNLDDGKLQVNDVGEAVIKAQLFDKDENFVKTLSAVKVISVSGEIEAIKLFIDGNDVTNGEYTLQGSEQKSIQVKAKYAGAEEFTDITYSLFTYVSSDKEYIFNEPQYASFHFEKPGSAYMTVALKSDENIKANVKLTSEYVAATSIIPGISGTFKIHGRNANDWQSNPPRFNPNYSGVIVTPSNASYNDRNYWTVSSSDESVGIYTDTAYVPVSAGTVTYTATLSYTEPSGNEVKISGSQDVTYEYENPLKSVTIVNDSFEMKNNTQASIDLEFAGTNEGFSISEPTLVWSYDKEGIVNITRNNKADGFKRDEAANDNNMYVLGTEYTVLAMKEGTVIATGTPKDSTGGAQPVTVTIKVTKGEDLPVVDIDRIVKEGIDNAVKYLDSQNIPYIYGSEWLVISMLRAGQSIDDADLYGYYTSVVEEISSWKTTHKPTDIERVALALTAMGKDITDVEGIDLAAFIYNHPNLDAGSNELSYALLALDAADITTPENAEWSRDKIVKALLKYQNEDGGFSLSGTDSSDIDLTAMALQALAPYVDNDDVKVAVDESLAFLVDSLSMPLYGYNSIEAEAQVILALSVLKIDPVEAGFGTEYRNIFSHLEDTYAAEGGGFKHAANDTEANNMATLQVLQGLEAYRRYAASEESYWDMSSVEPYEPGEVIIPNPSFAGDNVSAADTPKTGDENNIILWILITLLGCTGATAFRKREDEEKIS